MTAPRTLDVTGGARTLQPARVRRSIVCCRCLQLLDVPEEVDVQVAELQAFRLRRNRHLHDNSNCKIGLGSSAACLQ